MKRMLFLLAFIAPALVNAEPSSQIAWTPDILNLVKNGDLNKGKALAETCKSCHGDKGQGMKEETRDDEILPAIPALAGQVATYTYKQLRDYANGNRSHIQMTGIAKGLTERAAADLAVWFGSLPPAADKSGSKNLDRAEKMVESGDGKRILPP
ncbi:MAG: c-type cytochrome, partial [Methylococcales bacterium]|nr:c-type cytochrome [Methylococcales bacterium]